MKNYKENAVSILEYVGGPENISNMTHCATRLRLNLRDTDKANTEAIKSLEGVANVVVKAGQYQILVGTDVPKLYEEFEPLVKGNTNAPVTESADSGESVISKVFSAISGIFAPLLPALAGSGILRGLLILAVQLGLVIEGSGTYVILYSASMAVFYFLPILLAFSSAKRFGANQYISALIGAALLYPDLIALMESTGNGTVTSFFGIPTVLMNYSSTVVPIILAIWAYSYLYKFLDKHIPQTLQLVAVPLISLIVMVPLTLIVIGPLGVYGGEVIANAVNWLIERSGLLTGILVGGGWSVLVSFGIHWAVNPIMINNISQFGYDYICPLTFACNFAVIGVALGVWLKSRNKEVKNFAMTGAVTIALSAIIEPTLFGLLVKNKKLFLAQIIAGAAGGAYLGLMKVVTNAFVFGSVTTFPAFIVNNANVINGVIGLLISTVVGLVLGYLFAGKNDQLA